MYSDNRVAGRNRCSSQCRVLAAIPSFKGGMRDRWAQDAKHGKEYVAKTSGVRPVFDCTNWPVERKISRSYASAHVLRVRGKGSRARLTTKPESCR